MKRASSGSSTSEAASYGISVVDVRIRRADLPPEQNSQAVLSAHADRTSARRPLEFRAQGGQYALQEIRAQGRSRWRCYHRRGHRERPNRSAARATPTRNSIFRRSATGAQDADFAFYRSMQAYEKQALEPQRHARACCASGLEVLPLLRRSIRQETSACRPAPARHAASRPAAIGQGGRTDEADQVTVSRWSGTAFHWWRRGLVFASGFLICGVPGDDKAGTGARHGHAGQHPAHAGNRRPL